MSIIQISISTFWNPRFILDQCITQVPPLSTHPSQLSHNHATPSPRSPALQRVNDKRKPGASILPMIALRWLLHPTECMSPDWVWGPLSFWQLVRHRFTPQVQVCVHWMSSEETSLENKPITVTLPDIVEGRMVLDGGLCFKTSFELAVLVAGAKAGDCNLHMVHSAASAPRQRTISGDDLEVHCSD